MAREPSEILASNPIESSRVIHSFQPYQALSDDLVLLRAQRILASPASVWLSFDSGVLKAAGTAPYAWISDTRRLARVLPGVLQFDDAELATEMDLSRLAAPDTVSLKVHDGLLTASGSAPPFVRILSVVLFRQRGLGHRSLHLCGFAVRNPTVRPRYSNRE